MSSTLIPPSASRNDAVQQAAQSVIAGSTGNSSLDVSTLVAALVNSKIVGQASALTARRTKDNTTLSAFGALSSALTALQSSVSGLAAGSSLSTLAVSADGPGLTATTDAGAVAGSYSIIVSQVASSQVLSSAAFGSTARLGTGTLTINAGNKTMSVKIDSSNNTLSGIVSAINGSNSNSGVTATIVKGTDGAHMMLRSSNTGAANAIDVSISNVMDDNGLSSLGVTSTRSTTGSASSIVSSNASRAWKQSAGAQDASFSINGIAAASSSNAVTDAISGVTLNLSAQAVSTAPQTLTIVADTAAGSAAINSFVRQYNAVVTTMNSLTSFAAGAKSQGPLIGDSTLQTIKNNLASVVVGAVGKGNSRITLASIGINLKGDPADGTLAVDASKLTTALTANQATVFSLFNATNGIGEQLDTAIKNFMQRGGILDTRNQALNADLGAVAEQQSTLALYQSQLTKQYTAQFTALDKLMSTTNHDSQYLTALFGGNNSAGALVTNK